MKKILVGIALILALGGCSAEPKKETGEIAEIPALSAETAIDLQEPKSTPTDTQANVLVNDEYVSALVDLTEMELRSSKVDGDLLITASTIHDYVQEDDVLRVFVTTYYAWYTIEPDTKVISDHGEILPACITFVKSNMGEYELEEHLPAKDGGDWIESIQEFCVMPVTEEPIEGLAETIINDYSDHTNRSALNLERLREYLKSKGMEGYVLIDYEGAEPIPLT